MSERPESPAVAVVGAGAVGLTAANDLAELGVSVTVFERGEPGDGASSRAAGVLYDAYAEDADAALGGRSIERFREFSGTAGFEFQECPYVMLAREGDDQRAEAFETAAERMRANDRAVETLDGDELGERFPSLSTADVAAAAVASGAGWADTQSYVTAMAETARDAGVTIRTDEPVAVRPAERAVETAEEILRFDAILVTAGAHTKQLLADAGVDIPLKPYRVQALTATAGTNGDAEPHQGPMWYDATTGVYARPHPTGVLAGDGTVPEEADPDEWDRSADDWFHDDTTAVLDHRIGETGTVERSWAGLCTATPDGDPLLGELREGLYVGAGWQGHGFMRSPAHGELLAELVAGDLGVSDADSAAVPGGAVAVDAFDPTRFPDDVEFDVREGMIVEER